MIRRVALVAALGILAVCPASAQCVGDCDATGTVAVNELVLGVNIALARSELSGCASFDFNDDDLVAVNELIVAVNNALRGCFTGEYSATVALDGGATGRIELRAAPNGDVAGTLIITEPAVLAQPQGAGTQVTISGTFDPATGSFLIVGSFTGPGGTIDVRLSGTLGRNFTLEIGDAVYTGSFGAEPTRTPTPASGTVHTVKVGQANLPFDPEFLEIDPGDTVMWMWVAGPHSVRSAGLAGNGLPLCTPDGRFESPVQLSGTFSFTFNAPGRYGYHCSVAGHCDSFESGIIQVRGTPSPTPTRTWTPSPTIAIPLTPTPTATPETIGGVSTRMLGFFSGTATIGTQMYSARLQIEFTGTVIRVTDVSTAQFLFPNPMEMTVLSPTSLSFSQPGPPPITLMLSLNAAEHVVGTYTYTDPIMPHLPIDFDLVREE